jgi:phenylalanyl-tRNA synthetase beta chain
MRISLAWLSDHVDLSGLEPAGIAEALTLRTALIEGVLDQRAALAGVVVGRVLQRAPHPGADRLSLCTVDFGAAQPARVVCGAPNVAAGQAVFFAPVGTSLPNGVRLKAAKIRGELSEGMICAEDELALGPEHDGILVLPDALEPGQPAADVPGYADTVLEIDNKSITHRPDLWGHRGFARELAAIFGRELRDLPVEAALRAADHGPAIALEPGCGCPLYAGLLLEDEPRRSPDWLRFRLLACGLRPRNHLVDLSNYVMLDLGQPTHPFDADRLAGGRVAVRRARAGERLVTLDGEERVLEPADLVIADGERPVALAGILGGGNSEVTESTRRVFLESASFDATAVRRTSSRLGLRTDALARFEKALDPALVPLALQRYARLLRGLSPAARVAPGWREAGAARAPDVRLELSGAFVRVRLGAEVPDDSLERGLRSLGFGVEGLGQGRWTVAVPSWRATRDVARVEDLVEELGRIAGYERVPAAVPRGPLRCGRRDPVLVVEDRLRDALALRLAFTESIGYSVVSDADLSAAGWDAVRAGALPRLRNPLQQDAARLRPSPVPGLLGRLEAWLRHEEAPRVFEVGRGYATGPDGLVAERREVVALLAWSKPRDARDVVRELSGVGDEALGVLGHVRVGRRVAAPDVAGPWFHPRRCADLLLADGAPVGRLGAVAPGVLAALQVRGSAGLVVLDVDALAARPGMGVRYGLVSRFPPARIDLAFVVPYGIGVDSLREALRAAAPRTLHEVEAFDVYRGAPLADDERSLAFHLVFQAADRTLTDEEVEKARGRMVAAATALGCRLR